ncbi:NAD(P)-dependent alcohol dehydrogenase [soil metagenome]
MLIRAAVSNGHSDHLEIDEIEIGEPRDDELLVKLVATGICHTDLKQLGSSSLVPRPVVLGHEGAGVVTRVGARVSRFAPGDHVVMSVNSCGVCRSCQEHLPGYCVEVGARNFSGKRPDGSTSLSSKRGPIFSHFFGQSSFATHAICTERNAVRVTKDLPLKLLGPLGCGVQTGAGSVLNQFRIQPGQSFVVFGAGAVGMSAIMAAHLSGANPIIAVDKVAVRLSLARELGATSVINASHDDVVARIRSETGGGADFALDTTGSTAVFEQAMEALGPQGTCGLLATPVGSKTLSFAASPLILGGKTVQGIVQGSSDPQRFIPAMIDLYRAGRLPFDKLLRFYPFESINQAIEDAHSGEAVKPVLLFD